MAIALSCEAGCESPPISHPLDTGAERDAGRDSGLQMIDIAHPAEPSLPQLVPCPDGWRAEQITARGVRVTTCVPVSPSGCEHDSLSLPSGCTPIGRACPTGDFADVDDPDAVYVRPGAVGTGTREAPFGSIAEALSREHTEHIVLARGNYRESLVLTRPILIEGACATETILTPAPADDAVIEISAPNVIVRELSVDSARPSFVVHGNDADARLESVFVIRSGGSAIRGADGARLTLERVRVTGVSRNGMLRVAALLAETHAVITARAFDVQDVEAAVVSRTGARVDIEDASFSCRGAHCFGGVMVREGQARLARSRIIGEAMNALVVAEGEGTRARLERSFFGADTNTTLAFDISAGARLEGDRLHVRGAARVLEESESAAHVELSDVVFDQAHEGGVAHVVEIRGGVANLTRAMLIDMPGWVFRVHREGAFRLTDIHVLESAGTKGVVLVTTGPSAIASVSRMVIKGTYGFGLHATQEGSITAADVTIDGLDVANSAVRAFAAGFVGSLGGVLHAHRVRMRDIEGYGMIAIRSASIEAEDAVLEAPRLPDDPEAYALGAAAMSGATVRLLRARMSDSFGYGLFAGGEGTRLSATELIVDRVRSVDGLEHPAGTGMVAALGARIEASRFTVRAADECGMRILPGATMMLDLGMIRDSLIGACVQTPDIEFDRALRTVHFYNNETDLSVVALPLPTIPGVE